jgi:hypothetical protein
LAEETFFHTVIVAQLDRIFLVFSLTGKMFFPILKVNISPIDLEGLIGNMLSATGQGRAPYKLPGHVVEDETLDSINPRFSYGIKRPPQ